MSGNQPQLLNIDAFTVQGYQVRTRNADEAISSSAKIGSLWGRFYQAKVSGTQAWLNTSSEIYGVYSGYESDMNGYFYVTAAVPETQMTEGIKRVNIEAGKYLVFTGQGAMPQTVMDVWMQIWAYFTQDKPPHTRRYSTDFEAYIGADQVVIHIAVE